MSTVAWRRLLLVLCGLALIQTVVSVWMVASMGDLGITGSDTYPFGTTGSATTTPFVERLDVISAGPAYRAGLRSGDLVDLRRLSAADRYRWFTEFRAGEHVHVPVLRGNSARLVTLTAKASPFLWDWYLFYAGAFWILAFAGLVSWRRADSAEARVLALLLILLMIGSNFAPVDWITPWPGIDAIAAGLYPVFYFAAFALLATYAMLFALPPALLRRILAWLSYAAASITALYGIAFVAGVWTLTADPTHAWYSGLLTQITTSILPLLLPLLCVVATVGQTTGAERARIVWATASLGLLYVYGIVNYMVVVFNPGFNYRAFLYIDNLAFFVAPLGLTYSLLNRRLLDIGFVINRAVVFSAVSLIIVGIFILVEWALSEWFSTASHTTNLTISAAVALGLGLSVSAIHKRVDRIIDNVFFRKRHDDEQAIRNLAHEAAYITDANVLLQRVVETLEHHADASFATVLLDDGHGHYGNVDENDPAIVALRARHRLLDLRDVSTVLNGDLAYPMAARGHLVGVLILGPKRSGESYAPDESDAVSQLAHNAGAALDVLLLREQSSNDALLEAIKALPDALVDRLRAAEPQPGTK